MKLIKITDEYYVIVDDSEIKDNDWVADFRLDGRILISKWNEEDSEDGLFFDAKKITHSTQPMTHGVVKEGQITGVTAISLQEVKELIGEVDVKSKGENYSTTHEDVSDKLGKYLVGACFQDGYYTALEDNKEKKYTEDDLHNLLRARRQLYSHTDVNVVRDFIQSLQPKTEWEVEIVNNKINIK